MRTAFSIASAPPLVKNTCVNRVAGGALHDEPRGLAARGVRVLRRHRGEQRGLLLDGGDDARVPEAEVRVDELAGEVEQRRPLAVPDPGPLAAGDHQRLQRLLRRPGVEDVLAVQLVGARGALGIGHGRRHGRRQRRPRRGGCRGGCGVRRRHARSVGRRGRARQGVEGAVSHHTGLMGTALTWDAVATGARRAAARAVARVRATRLADRAVHGGHLPRVPGGAGSPRAPGAGLRRGRRPGLPRRHAGAAAAARGRAGGRGDDRRRDRRPADLADRPRRVAARPRRRPRHGPRAGPGRRPARHRAGRAPGRLPHRPAAGGRRAGPLAGRPARRPRRPAGRGRHARGPGGAGPRAGRGADRRAWPTSSARRPARSAPATPRPPRPR